MIRRSLEEFLVVRGWGLGLSVLSAAMAIPLYLFGLMHVLRLESEYHTCSYWRFGLHDGAGWPTLVEFTDSYLPLSAICRWDDGHSLNNVPSYVNPGLALLLGLAAVVAIATAALGHRRRASRRSPSAAR